MLLSLVLIATLASVVTAGIPPLQPVWSYTGCLYDGYEEKERLMWNLYYQDDKMTINLCLDICAKLGMPYAGLYDTNKCYCIPTLGAHKLSFDEASCDAKCVGDTSQPCGTRNLPYLTLLQYTPPAPSPPVPIQSTPTPPTPIPAPNSQVPIAPVPSSSTSPPPASQTIAGTGTSNPTSSVALAPGPSPSSGSYGASSGPVGASSASSSIPPQVSQYLSFGPAAGRSSAYKSSLTGSGTPPSSSTVPLSMDRYFNATITRSSGGVIAPPRLKDEAQTIVFGTVIGAGQRSRPRALSGETIWLVLAAVLGGIVTDLLKYQKVG